ncbi:hypothetical protein ACLHDG_00120 [Sulfurovum sp. CS9]|uniref:hypothetical protein n=1 Tax=Sulfurovum sp. CS9 TaxID=3391146 RepID=UPI0039ECBE23
MKKLLIALGLGVLMMGSSAMAIALATPPPDDCSEGLGIQDGETGVCCLYNGIGGLVPGVLKDINVDLDGSITIKCSSDGKVAKPTKKAVKYDVISEVGITCHTVSMLVESLIGYEQTDDWRNVVSASGISSLICHYREVPLTVPAPI